MAAETDIGLLLLTLPAYPKWDKKAPATEAFA